MSWKGLQNADEAHNADIVSLDERATGAEARAAAAESAAQAATEAAAEAEARAAAAEAAARGGRNPKRCRLDTTRQTWRLPVKTFI